MKIIMLPYQPHFFSFGGFELQILNTFNSIQKIGLNIELGNVWSTHNNFDILHFWGWGFTNCENISFAQKAKKKTIATCLFSYFDSPKDQIKYALKFRSYRTKAISQFYQKLDALVVVNELQADICAKYFGIKSSKIHVVPNVVDDIYFKNSSDIFTKEYNFKDFVLTTGNICRRKNQITLAKACQKIGSKLLIVGKVLDGEEDYATQLAKIIANNSDILWIKGLEPNSKMMMSAYSSSKAFALPGFYETQPISALEAAAMGKPILLGKFKYADQKYYKNSIKAIPQNVDNISNGLIRMLNDPTEYTVPNQLIEPCRGINVAEAYKKIYMSILQ